MREIILALLFWISGQTGYEVNIDPPRLVFLSPSQVVDICIDEGTLIPYAAEACYKLHKHAIYLRDDFNLYRADQMGTLVHELTHVLQLSNGRDYNLNTMDALESEANNIERVYESSKGIQRKVQNLAAGGVRVGGLSGSQRAFGADAYRTAPVSPPKQTLAARDPLNQYGPYDLNEKYPRATIYPSTPGWEFGEPSLPLPPKDKKRATNQSLLKKEILTRLGRYSSPNPKPIEGRILNKMRQRPYQNDSYEARSAPPRRPSRYYVLVLPGDTVSRLAGMYGVSPNAIRALNGIRGETLVPGQRILIP